VNLFDSNTGGFRQNPEIGVNILSSTDVVWIRYATNDKDLGAPDRKAFLHYLEESQDPVTGNICHARGPASQGHCDAHAFWQAVRAIHLLGGRLQFFPHHLKSVLAPEGLAHWFDSVNWDCPKTSNHHEVLGLVPLLASLNDPEWTEVFYSKLAQQQDEVSGTWPRSQINISRTFAYTVLHIAAGKLPKFSEKIVDAMLASQGSNGFWDPDLPAFHTMDAAYLLARLPKTIHQREEEAREALVHLARELRQCFAEHQMTLLENPHRTLAITQTFGLLQEVFPQDFLSDRPYRFDWENNSVYACPVIGSYNEPSNAPPSTVRTFVKESSSPTDPHPR